MIFWGITGTGENFLLGEPEEASLSYDRDAPADLLRAKFPADSIWPELSEVTGYLDDSPIFRGIVDEQNTALSTDGISIELVCRSLEALLLDNEAKPETISAPSLIALEDRLLTPAGLSLGGGDRERKRGKFTISKGESCWTALERFCKSFLGTVPYVDLNGLVQCGGSVSQTLELTDVLSAQVSSLPCKRISEVWQQSCRGLYDTRYRNEKQGLPRRRYASMESGKNPKSILEAGERDSFLLTVTCAGMWWPGGSAWASVAVPGAGRFENCPVRGALFQMDRSGERTRLTLERGTNTNSEGDGAICG